MQPVNAGDLQDQGSFSMESYAVTVDGTPIEEPSLNKFAEKENITQEASNALCDTKPASFIRRLLYTKDKSKKAKSWYDGYIKYDGTDKLARFYNDDDKLIHSKKCEAAEVGDGSLLETGMFIFDIGEMIDSVPAKVSALIDSGPKELMVDYDCDLEAAEPCFNMVYTEDKVKKTKKWKDGYLRFVKESGTGFFYGEDGKLMFKRGIKWRQIDEQEEITTARYIIQINEMREAVDGEEKEEEEQQSTMQPLRKQQRASNDEEIILSPEDQTLFIEHAVFYTADKMKKNKKWAEGLLWYDSGLCSIFDEEGKLLLKKKMHSKDIFDGLEFITFRYNITVGGAKHRYHKDPKVKESEPELQAHVEEPPEDQTEATQADNRGRSFNQVLSMMSHAEKK